VWDRLRGARHVAPPGPGAQGVEADLEALRRRGGEPRLTWLGHASFLLTVAGAHLLVDPVLVPRLGGFYRRHAPLPVTAGDLPELDALLVTHSHYDHLDAPTLRHVPRSVPVFVPAGLGSWFAKRGFSAVTELEWWQQARTGELAITLLPSRHWSRRTFFDTNTSLWGGFVVEGGGSTVYHAGDSGWCDTFREIGRRFPRIGTALLPIGAYSPAWFMEPAHMNPEQAGRAFLDLPAHTLVPMHWGTYQLTDEPVSEPIQRLEAWWAENGPSLAGRRLARLAVGESLELSP
jgi:L-ascorbate metabolism protein UlaG (beta-lactamase superfamily)